MAVNIAIVVFLGNRFAPDKENIWATLTIAGTIGVLFGTPLAAALMLSESMANRSSSQPLPLWDRLIAPLCAAGAGSLTTHFLGGPSLSVKVPAYGNFQLIDLFSGSLIAAISAVIGLVAIYIYPYAHQCLAKLRHPAFMIIVGGILLGVLGIIGREVTLFKGLDQMKSLTMNVEQYAVMGLMLIIVVKLIAIVIAAASGFRGGRIFPALFVGVAIGLLAYRLFPSIPLPLAVSCGALGILLAITRQGWLAFFMALVAVPDITLLPVLTFALLPAWLIVTGRAQMEIPKDKAVICP